MRSHLVRRRVLGLVLLGGLLTGGPAWADDLADAFKRADADADGTLTPAEFRTFIDLRAEAGGDRAKAVKARALYDRAFARIDANRDGKLTLAEIST